MKINYKEKRVIEQSEEMKKDVEFAIEETSLQLKSDILATKQEVKSLEKELEDAKCEYPLDVNNIILIQEDLDAAKRGLEYMEKLQKELGL